VFHNNLGMALERTGRFRAAEGAYREAVAADESYEKALANLSRIEIVAEDPGVEPIDLTAAALRFVDQIDLWKLASVEADTPDVSNDSMDAVAIGAADSTSTTQEQ